MPRSLTVPDYALFQSSLPDWVHSETVDMLVHYGSDGTPHEAVPKAIVYDREVRKAVDALLGPDWKLDACRHIHTNSHPEDGEWHQDNYDEGPWPEGNWAMLFYFPQETPLEMGGTSILVDGQEVIGAGPAGTCLLARGDVVHRARANTTGKQRYMLKYLFRADHAS